MDDLKALQIREHLLSLLARRAQGTDDHGRPMTPEAVAAAGREFHALARQIESDREVIKRNEEAKLHKERELALAERTAAMDAGLREKQILLEAENRSRELDIEQQRVDVEKARVVAQVLEKIALGGPEALNLLPLVQSLGRELFGGSSPLAIEAPTTVAALLSDSQKQ